MFPDKMRLINSLPTLEDREITQADIDAVASGEVQDKILT